jgi:hypothetical protein
MPSPTNRRRLLPLHKKILFFLALFFVLVALVAVWRGVVSHVVLNQVARDIEKVKELHVARKSGKTRQHADEKRYTVVKRLWLSDTAPRLELEMRGAESKIDLTTSQKGAECTEVLYDVQGVVQEELFYMDEQGDEYSLLSNGMVKSKKVDGEVSPAALIPMQRFRYFEANRAVYDYRNNTLIAYDVNFWTYCTSGHELKHEYDTLFPQTAGVASSMTLCHKGTVGSLQFSAENLKMQLGP